jgi:hypothetical protein
VTSGVQPLAHARFVGGPPVKVPFFDDASSYGHGLLGLAAAFIPSGLAAAIAAGYIFYQLNEVEPIPNKIGDFGEFAIGFLGGKAVKWN